MKILFLFAAIVLYSIPKAQQILTYNNQLNLVPEGIAIDSTSGNIFISSIAHRKIIKILQDGSSSDFIPSGQDGFLEGLGMKVDDKRKLLWALSNFRSNKTFTSQIHAFDLVSGKTRHRFSLKDTIPSLLNDLLLDLNGNLIITDTYSSSIYHYDVGENKLQIVIRDTAKCKWPNGLDFFDTDNVVIATYGKGIVKVNLKSKEISPLAGYKNEVIAHGLDGLVANGNALYGVYNAGQGGYSTNAIIKYTLDTKRERITAEETMALGNAAFADPTTAAVHKNKLYVIANSHLDDFNKNKETIVGIENILTPLKILVLQL